MLIVLSHVVPISKSLDVSTEPVLTTEYRKVKIRDREGQDTGDMKGKWGESLYLMMGGERKFNIKE